MYKSIIYKEWLKIRWALALFLVAGLLALVNIFLNVRYGIRFMDAHEFWYGIIIQGGNYAASFKYIPLFAGLGLAVSQYYPEILDQRIKLTFHLPIRENKVLLLQHGFGLVCLLAVYLVYVVIFITGSGLYFPAEVTVMIGQTILPWFLGGLATYSLVALIMLEPLWLYRVLYAVIAYGLVSQYYIEAVPMAYTRVMWVFALFSVATVIVQLFSGYRFRKGEMHHG
ncbi:MAG: hypothetical protein ACLFMU_05665 [Bacteroidales bacterium]